jgi:hypothetical protein
MKENVKSVDVTWFLALLIIIFSGFMIYKACQPFVPPTNPWDGCELLSVVKTEDRRYCGKACSMPVYADTYQCQDGQKTFLDARWSVK